MQQPRRLIWILTLVLAQISCQAPNSTGPEVADPERSSPEPPSLESLPDLALEPVPRPSLDRLEEIAQERIEQQHRTLDDALRDELGDPAELAAVYGELGRTYFAFSFRDAAAACFTNATRLAPSDFNWRYYRGTLLQERGELDDAATELAAALALEPADQAARLHLARVELDRGQAEAARDLYRQALDDDPSLAAAHYGLGLIALSEKRSANAIATLSRALDLAPEAKAIHQALGTAYRRDGDLDKARVHLEQAGPQQPRFADPLLDDLGSLVTGARVFLDQGLRAKKAGDLDLAMAYFHKALELDAENVVAHHNLGSVFGLLDHHADALPHLERAIELDPERRDAHFDRASALTRLNRLEEATEAFDATLAIDPDDRLARYRLALVLNARGEVGRSIDELKALCEAQPDDLEARLRLARMLLENGRAAEASTHYDAALRLAPEDPEAPRGKARALLAVGSDAEARSFLETRLAAGSSDAVLARTLARLLAASSQPDVRDGEAAMRLAQALFDRDKTLENAVTVALAMAELGRFDEAASWQESLVQQSAAAKLDADKLAILQAHLELYRNASPVRGVPLEP